MPIIYRTGESVDDSKGQIIKECKLIEPIDTKDRSEIKNTFYLLNIVQGPYNLNLRHVESTAEREARQNFKLF